MFSFVLTFFTIYAIFIFPPLHVFNPCLPFDLFCLLLPSTFLYLVHVLPHPLSPFLQCLPFLHVSSVRIFYLFNLFTFSLFIFICIFYLFTFDLLSYFYMCLDVLSILCRLPYFCFVYYLFAICVHTFFTCLPV